MSPDWSAWQASTAWGLGVEEEVMLLEAGTGRLAKVADDVLPRLERRMGDRVCSETHRGVVELVTAPHDTVGGAVGELVATRAEVEAVLEPDGLVVAAAGTHPMVTRQETDVSPGGRHQLVLSTMAGLARREPTFALHVHVAVPDPDDAIRLMGRLRWRLPLLLALSANSPFWQGRDAGMASTRTPLFGAFPRTGLPPFLADYGEWIDTVDLLVRSEAIPDPTFLWWDLRPQPRFGTLELRIMDAQIRTQDTAALVALSQALARLELTEGVDPPAGPGAEQALLENRFLAARDGVDAELIDAVAECRRPVRELLAELLDAATPHAQDLGCAPELAEIASVASEPGAARQRRLAAASGGPSAVAGALAAQFT